MLIGIVGTHGAGKGTLVNFFKQHNFIHCSVRELLTKEAEKAGLEPNRKNLADIANALRGEFSPDYIVERFLAKHDPAVNDVLIESIYTQGEAQAIRLRGGYIIAIDADPKIRYKRIQHRKSATDFISEEQFLERQKKEGRSDDPTKQNSLTVMDDADFTLINNGTIEELGVRVEEILKKIEEEG